MGNIFRIFEAPREQVIPFLPNDIESTYSAEAERQNIVPPAPAAAAAAADGWRMSPRRIKKKNRKRKRSRY